MKSHLINVFFLLIIHFSINSQIIQKSSIDSGGASTVSAGLSILYTIGESNVDEVFVGGVGVSEGFIQSTDGSNVLNIEDNILDSDLSIYPNPATTKIFIKGNIDSIEFIELYTIAGQIVIRLDTNYHEINISDIESGVYFFKIVNAVEQKILKFIKQ